MSLPSSLDERLAAQQAAFQAAGAPSADVRRHRLDRLLALLFEHAETFAAALAADFGTRSRTASILTEMVGVASTIEYSRKNVARWMRPRRPATAARFLGLSAEVQPTPKGVVGIIGPWNFPLNLVVLPAADAFAAGNRVMIKMSELTPRTTDAFAQTAPKYFDAVELDVVVGDVEVAQQFASLPFDHLFFTGSPAVGRHIHRAASANLVPVTLELGGKNPVVVGPKADIARSASRVARSRLVNGGQTCLCPDYVLVPSHAVENFCRATVSAIRDILPSILGNEDMCSSINDANYERVIALVEDAQSKGADVISVAPPHEQLPDSERRVIAPTLVTNVDSSMRITCEEIFGPVLVVMGYEHNDEAIDYINRRPSPLIAYWYGPDDEEFRHFVTSTRSGSVSRNDFALHMSLPQVPFGGVGHSGMGAYHGRAGFDTFSHQRPVVGSELPFSITSIAAPPFSRAKVAAGDLWVRSIRRRARRRIDRFER
ncbi:coniferyl aldehyde dehydrogenase [Mycobacterium paraffinicum]|uniref:Aldehyde dehydrogenase n=1 Tax=Mycobacterium paraffinicum TaxID=53378 RepID=A0A1Q4HNR2_9MYCO|nr:coniferyl aldehyde dehydrogenase [Mycobacterium paraffinicum]